MFLFFLLSEGAGRSLVVAKQKRPETRVGVLQQGLLDSNEKSERERGDLKRGRKRVVKWFFLKIICALLLGFSIQ